MIATPDAGMIENRVYDEIVVGDSASVSRRLTEDDIQLFAVVSGDVNPAHLDPAYAGTDLFHKIIGHGMWSGALISAVLGTRIPGPGTIYLSQDLQFCAPVAIGDLITATVTAREKKPEKKRIVFDCTCLNQDGTQVVTGTAEVQAPTEKVCRPRMELPEVRLNRHRRFRELLAQARGGDPVPMAVAHPCDAAAISAVAEVAALDLVAHILVGPEGKIRSAAEAAGIGTDRFQIKAAPHSQAAAALAVALGRSRGADEGIASYRRVDA